jgi:hypothetical protein
MGIGRDFPINEQELANIEGQAVAEPMGINNSERRWFEDRD